MIGFSKKNTRGASVSREARIWAKLTIQSCSPSPSSCWVTATSCPSPASPWSLTSDPRRWRPRWPTSPICSTRLVTVAMAWKSSLSPGSPWNMLYNVLQNWMNSRWAGKGRSHDQKDV
uniref:Uncharacterized protein n=1 Tax=Gadus morhua TaxID=8049 RepID=A0A8C5CU50_GADMO